MRSFDAIGRESPISDRIMYMRQITSDGNPGSERYPSSTGLSSKSRIRKGPTTNPIRKSQFANQANRYENEMSDYESSR